MVIVIYYWLGVFIGASKNEKRIICKKTEIMCIRRTGEVFYTKKVERKCEFKLHVPIMYTITENFFTSK